MELKNPLKGKSRTVQALVVIGVILLLIGIVYAVTTSVTISSSGTISTPASITSDPPSIDWDTIPYGSTTSLQRQVTLHNIGEETTGSLNMTSTINIGTLTWNGEGSKITGGASALYTFTLTPSGTAPSGPFNFNITISG